MLIDIYRKILTNKQLQLSESLDFINQVIKTYKPEAIYNEDNLVKLLQNGLGNMIIQSCISIVSKNPELFKIQTTVLKDKSNNIIKILIYDIK